MLKSVAPFKPTLSFNFSRVGLSSTRFLNVGHVTKGEASDRRRVEILRMDGVDSRSTDHHQTHVAI